MKKRFLLFLTGMACAAGVAAQSPITLKAQDFFSAGMPKNDQVGVITSFLTLTQINFNAANSNFFWDMGGINYNSFYTIQRDSIAGPAAGGLPVYQYGEPQQTQLGNVPYTESMRYQRDTFGLFSIGEDVSYQAIGLGNVTGFNTDTLYIPSQGINYTYRVIDFPETAYDNWSDTIQYTTQYQLTMAAAQYNRRPFTRNTMKAISTAVIGWGKAIVADPSRGGRASAPIDVLQLEVKEVTLLEYRDDNGGLMDPAILSALALENTIDADTVGYILLMRKGETTPLLRMQYDGTPFSSTPQKAWVHVERLPASQSVVSTAASTEEVKIYPNPVRRGEALSIDCTAAGDWQLRLSSLTGQQVLDARWKRTNAGVEAVQMPPVAPGMYIYQLFQNGQPMQTGRVLMAE